jgi:acyl-CoA-binding protein
MTISEREDLVNKTIAHLQSIQTLEEYKAAKGETMDLMEKIFRSAIEVLKYFFDNMLTMSPEEQQAFSAKTQEDNFLLNPDIMKEFDRLEKMPGALEFSNSFSAEMQERMSPYLEEFSEQMGKLMETFMGNMIEGISGAFGVLSGVDQTPDNELFTYDELNPDTPFVMYALYTSRSLADLQENKEGLIQSLDGQLEYDSWDMRRFAENEFKNMYESDLERLAKIRKLMERIEPELDREFARIAALPGSSEEATLIKKELMERIGPRMAEIKGYLAGLKE